MDQMLKVLLAVILMVSISPAQGRRAEENGKRFHSDRARSLTLPLPKEDDAFTFAVYGDRTGGPAIGIEVLKQAVKDTNLLDPDLVMTVGDLVQGYNERPEWLEQMHEFKQVMGGLEMPWFPVAGNHDVYWRGPNRPEGEHDSDYETHFGPLWYAFTHKKCWFVVLYSDEGDPKTGEKSFSRPASQSMSPEQYEWLSSILLKAKDARHVFVFLHHPRWTKKRYGKDWDRVHKLLATHGNVSGVFAGHIHRMRYDGKRDGIEYYALATVGGHLSAEIPDAGYLHHLNLVTVREEGIVVSTLPVGTVMDPKKITGEMSDDVTSILRDMRPEWKQSITVNGDFSVTTDCILTVNNPAKRDIEVTATLSGGDEAWTLFPDHQHAVVAPGKTKTFRFGVRREARPLSNEDFPVLKLQADYLAEGFRISIPESTYPIPLFVKGLKAPANAGNLALRLDGKNDCLRVDSKAIDIPQGALTLEGWMKADAFSDRQAFVTKTESCEFGIFVSKGKPDFSVHLNGKYRNVRYAGPALKTGQWYHLAGVFDGREIRLYIDGHLVGQMAAQGKRTRRSTPLVIGADPGRGTRIMSYFPGLIDEVRLSKVARYQGKSFKPAQRFDTDPETLMLLHMDGVVGPWMYDASPAHVHPRRQGGVGVTKR